ncbi:hypothetical protein SODALDRAFT_358407 [Sodiomyces alkalinus F11]|uniref:Uncharacterized protein n=1 Tax=Sodiomyces alkalinus (strain CBS 110278 / VKM F-3762 / F11) TaxID=1314773 RepID=A0A3N2PZN7_SODAK|nr:hypothetical protein SODALDRAFT_358407 [Sodiomyces alkalinus F11]ROT39989.1 hypothetical protein SODALDRAFT_358407 [Sodiomyces alkalinus F11]
MRKPWAVASVAYQVLSLAWNVFTLPMLISATGPAGHEHLQGSYGLQTGDQVRPECDQVMTRQGASITMSAPEEWIRAVQGLLMQLLLYPPCLQKKY